MTELHHSCWQPRAGIACALLACCGPAGAFLGGDSATVELEARSMQGVLQTSAYLDYDVHQIAAAAGQTVREYVSRQGIVFAVTWSGPVPPDLEQLMGAHFTAYSARLAALPHAGLNRSLRIELPDLVVESSGHLRAYSGRAYLPSLLPAGVRIQEIR